MSMKQLSAFLAAALLLIAIPAAAHHSVAAEYDVNKPVTLRGTLTKVEWTNPHGWLYLDVKQPDGKVVSWAAETGAPNSLIRSGLRKTDFPIGAEIVVHGYQSKTSQTTVNTVKVEFADGRNFNIATPTNGLPIN
jgi:hypothetical protein